MAINQLFKIKPSKELVKEIIGLININIDKIDNMDTDNIENKKFFTIKELNDLNILDKVCFIKNKIKDYYLPCKQKIYFNNITIKKLLTIFRQLLKLYNYKIISVDKYDNGKKFIIYIITHIVQTNNKKNINCIISFD